MRVFLTGGSGYVGTATIAALVRAGHDVTAIARSDDATKTVAELGAEPVRGGLHDLDVLRAAAAKADGAIHLGMVRGEDTAAVDLAAAEAILDGLGGGTYVHTGGTWVYGNTDGVVNEDALLQPPKITSWRAANEKKIMASGGRPVLVMPGLVYGRSAGLIEAFFTEPARSSGEVAYIGDGSQRWALVHVDDIADLYVRALEAPAGAVYAGVSDQNIPMIDIAKAISGPAGCPGKTVSISLAEAERRMGPIAEAFALDQQLTGERARQQLGWQPAHLDALKELAEV
jgi:nucleoside-diphosphate-sugar epimerase